MPSENISLAGALRPWHRLGRALMG